jgi:hypothetical protein
MSETNRKSEVIKFIEEHKGELMLDFTTVVKLTGFDEDDLDYYYKCQSLIKGEYYTSCVCDLFPLKGIVPNETYEYLVHHFDMNIEMALAAQEYRKEHKDKVFVNWDPLLENVICVHKSEDGTCPKCEEIIKKRYEERCYHVAGDWFEIKE